MRVAATVHVGGAWDPNFGRDREQVRPGSSHRVHSHACADHHEIRVETQGAMGIENELSAKDISDLVAKIRATGVKAIFSESSRTVTTAEPPIRTLTIDFSAVLILSSSKILSLNLSGSEAGVASRETVACPWSVVTMPT